MCASTLLEAIKPSGSSTQQQLSFQEHRLKPEGAGNTTTYKQPPSKLQHIAAAWEHSCSHAHMQSSDRFLHAKLDTWEWKCMGLSCCPSAVMCIYHEEIDMKNVEKYACDGWPMATHCMKETPTLLAGSALFAKPVRRCGSA